MCFAPSKNQRRRRPGCGGRLAPLALSRLVCILQLLPAMALGGAQKVVTHFALDAAEVPARVKSIVDGEPWLGKERGPVEGLMLFAQEKSGAVWLGGDQGAARFDRQATPRWDRWQYFHSRRWLLDDSVQNIFADETGAARRVWIRTK